MSPSPCPACGQPTTPGKRFCGHCGAHLPAHCPQCGAATPLGMRFCEDCGTALTSAAPGPAAARPAATPLVLEEQFATFQRSLPSAVQAQILTAPEGENRVLTILFADLTGSTARTVGLLPEEGAAFVDQVLKVMVDAILTYEGRINRLLGDAVLAFFGTPLAHENDPERAVLAALELREAVQALGLNVTAGINTGEVYLGTIGAAQHWEITAQGPVVNLAARLREQAAPGQILVGETVYRQTRRAFEFTRQEVHAKGFAEPVPAYEVLRPLPRPEKVRGIEGLRATLIGRERELAQLTDALAEVHTGRGQIACVIGDAGVGKSRLIAELKEAATISAALGTQHAALLWLEGRCLDVGMAVSYWPFIDMVRTHIGLAPNDDDDARGRRLRGGLDALVQQGALNATRAEEMLPVLGNLLAAGFGSPLDERLAHAGPEQIKHQTFLALVDLVVALAHQQPLVVVLDDLHWADSLSLDVIALLMDTLRLAPVFLVCAYRPEQEHKCWHLATIAQRKCPDRYVELRLRELSPPQSRRLVESLLHIEALPPAVKEQILAKTQGNPFFVEEVVRSLIDTGLVYHDGTVWRAHAEVNTLAVPESVQSVILSRVDRLDAEVKHVLQSASVIGRLFRQRLLGQVVEKEVALEGALAVLEDRQLIYEERAIPEEEYSFQHVLTQETVYQSILRRRRVVFHQQVAGALEHLYGESLEEYYEQLVHHYTQAEAWSKALDYLMKAGAKAAAAYANQDALAFYTEALAVCAKLDDAALPVAAAAAEKRANVHGHIGNSQSAVDDYEQMREIACRLGDRRLEGLALAYRGVAEQQTHAFETAEQTLRAALAVAGDDHPEVWWAATDGLTFLFLVSGRLAEAAAFLRIAEEWVRQRQEHARYNPRGARLVLHNWAGRFAEAIADVEALRAAASPAERDAPVWEEALARGGRGEYQKALEIAHSVLADSERTGDWFHLPRALNTIGWLHGEIQDHQRALEWNTRSLVKAQESNAPNAECENNARLNLGDALAALGRLEEAEEQFQAVERMVRRRSPQDHWMAWRYAQHLFHSYGELWLVRGDADRALAYADECLQLAERTGSRKNIVKGCRLRGQALAVQGTLPEAEQELARALELAQEVGNPSQLWKTHLAWGDLRIAQGRVDEARVSYRAALAIIEGVAAALEDKELRETFLGSAHVQYVRHLAGEV